MGGLRKSEAQLLLNLVKNMKGKKKGIYGCIISKRKTRENAGLLLNLAGDVVAKT